MRTTPRLLPFILTALAGCSSSALADSSWTNADGGSWSDPANWSNGVPGPADSALLPPLDADGYTITLAPGLSVKSLRVGATATLVGGSLGVTEALAVGTDLATGELTMSGVQATTGQVLVGRNGGTGSLTLRDSTVLQTSYAACAFGGVGTLEIRAGSTLVAGSLELFSASTLRLWSKPDAITPVIAATCARGGSLVLLAEPSVSLPNPLATMMTTWTAATGAFSSVVPPVVDGYTATFTILPTVIFVDSLDPFVALDIVVEPEPVFVGCSHSLDVIGTRLSGSHTSVCCANVDFTVSPPSAVITGLSGLAVVDDGPFTLSAEYVTFGVPVSGSRVLQGSTDHPYVYEVVSSDVHGDLGNGPSGAMSSPRWTADGRYVAFGSGATNLVVPDPEPLVYNLFVKDRWTGNVELVDVPPRGVAFNGPPDSALDIADDGRLVTFVRKTATESGVPRAQVWLRDREAGTTTLASRSPKGAPGNADSMSPRIAADGGSIVYVSVATNLVDGVSGQVLQILRYDVATGTTSLLSATHDGVPANNHCRNPAVSADGTIVAFDTLATNLWPDASGQRRVLVRDLARGAWSRVDVSSDGVPGNGVSQRPSLTRDGRFVSFESTASTLSALGSFNSHDIFVHDRATGATQLVTPFEALFSSGFTRSSISDDGDYVTCVGGSMSETADTGAELLRVRRSTLQADVVALTPWGNAAGVSLAAPQLSPDGGEILFSAPSKNLVPAAPAFPAVTLVRSLPVAMPGDLTGDGAVDAADLAALLGAWGGVAPGDLDGDGTVGATDLGLLLGAWTG
ncbi:MAG: hypothetical protein JNM94_16500 [Phycisphaerae bacterium]|nr:hypothetical protein [Phycisphaerae bacterium]